MRYLNRNGKEFSQVLVDIAKQSPPAYAAVIRSRNEALLTALAEYEASDNKSEFRKRVDIGCPHCKFKPGLGYMCEICLWTKLTDIDTWRLPCTTVEFPDSDSLSHVRCASGLLLTYATEYAEIDGVTARDGGVELVRAFLQDHVDWANLECWGEDYEKTAAVSGAQ